MLSSTFQGSTGLPPTRNKISNNRARRPKQIFTCNPSIQKGLMGVVVGPSCSRPHTHTHTHTHTGLAVHFDCARGACWEADWSCVNRDRQGCVWIVLTTPSRRDWSEVRRLGLSRVLRRAWFCGQTLPAFLVKICVCLFGQKRGAERGATFEGRGVERCTAARNVRGGKTIVSHC